MDTFTLQTQKRNQFVDITSEVEDSLRRQEITNGLGLIYCPHTTAGITINENCDPDVVHDMLLWLERAIPHVQPGFLHNEGNSDSHIKASLIGSSKSVIVSNKKLVLGRWQGIFLCEFDGPRTRSVHVQWFGSASGS